MFNRDDSRFGTLMAVGVGAIVLSLLVGGLGFLLLLTQGKGIFLVSVVSPILLALGLLFLGGILVQALWREKQGDMGKGLRIENGAWIQARFAVLPGSDEMVFSEEFFDPDVPGVKILVRPKYPDGRVDEPKTTMAVWRECGEGMVGVAEIQGDWLTRFTPQPRPPGPTRVP